MKPLYLLLFSLFLQPAFAQKTSLSVYVKGGLGSFRGESAVKTTNINTGGPFCMCKGSQTNSFGAASALSYGGGVVVQRQFKNNMLLGLDAGYELLRTKANIGEIQLDDIRLPGGGKSISYNYFANIFPHIGYNFNVNEKVSIALTGGADFGIGLDSYHKTSAGDYFDKFKVDTDIIPGLDFRPRLQVKVGYQKFGFAASYSYGLKNWMGQYDGGNPEAYMKVFRLGVQYQLF